MTDQGAAEHRPDFTLSRDEALERSGVDPRAGLDASEVAKRAQQYGPNKFAEAPPDPAWQRFVRQYQDLMQIVLRLAGMVSIWPVEQISTGITRQLVARGDEVTLYNRGQRQAAIPDGVESDEGLRATVPVEGVCPRCPAGTDRGGQPTESTSRSILS